MRTEAIAGISWRIPEASDFTWKDGDETFPIFEDEQGGGFYGYGHIPESEFLQQVNRYLRHFSSGFGIDGNEELEESGEVRHVYAKITDTEDEWRFSWSDVTADTPHAFPLTLIEW